MRPANWRDPLLDLSVIGPAFQLLFRRWQEYALLGFISFMVIVACAVPGYLLMFGLIMNGRSPDIGQMLAIYPILYGGLFLGMGIAYPFNFGIANFTIREVLYSDATLADAWLPLKSYFKYMGAGLALVLALIVSSICGCGIGGLIVSGLFMFVIPIMLHEKMGVFDAMKESFERCKSQWGMAIVVALVCQLLSAVGEFACLVGVFLTMPLIYIIPTMIYLNGFPSPNQISNPLSPYPRGGSEYGQNIGEQPRQKPEGEPPPKPDDYS